VRISHHANYDREVDDRQVAHHAEHGLLLTTLDVRNPHQLGRTAEIGAGSGRNDLSRRLAPTHERTGTGDFSGLGFGRDRLAREHRLIKKHCAGDDPKIGGNDAAERGLHDVARNEIGCWRIDPRAVAPDARFQREPLLEQRESCIGTIFLENAEPDIEDQQCCDHQWLEALAERDLQRDRRLEHPRHRRPEMAHDPRHRVGTLFGHRIRAKFQEPAGSLRRRQTSRGGSCGYDGFYERDVHFSRLRRIAATGRQYDRF
jgi:hypothetical protein